MFGKKYDPKDDPNTLGNILDRARQGLFGTKPKDDRPPSGLERFSPKEHDPDKPRKPL